MDLGASGKKALLWSSGIAAIGIAAGAMSHNMANQLAAIALDRECPRKISPATSRRFTGITGCDAFLQALDRGKAALEAREQQTITLQAQDTVHLVGHWVPSPDPRRILIAMHGWRSCWSRDFGLVADFFFKNGCSVLYAEQRGQQSSSGEYMGLGVLERYDCLEWVRKVNAITGGSLPVYLGGISMGAATVMMAAGLELPENVRGIIADCGFTSAYDIGKHILRKNLRLPMYFSQNTVERICRKKLQVSVKNCSTLEALRKTRLPVLLLHGTEDHFVPVRMSYQNYEACGGPRELVVFPGADHGMSYYLDPQRYEAALLDFWQRYDGTIH